MISLQLQSIKQGYLELQLANDKSRGYLFQAEWSKYFSTLDLRAGYHHIPLDKSSIPKTAFNSPFGKYEYVKVPFWISSGSSIFSGINDWNFEGF